MTDKLTGTTATDNWGPRHLRTISWHDPGPSLNQAMTMSGIEHLQAMMDGDLPAPPFAELMQIEAACELLAAGRRC